MMYGRVFCMNRKKKIENYYEIKLVSYAIEDQIFKNFYCYQKILNDMNEVLLGSVPLLIIFILDHDLVLVKLKRNAEILLKFFLVKSFDQKPIGISLELLKIVL